MNSIFHCVHSENCFLNLSNATKNKFKKPVAMLYTSPSAIVFQLSTGVECRINAVGVKSTLHLSAYDFNLNFSILFLVEPIFTTIYQMVVDI